MSHRCARRPDALLIERGVDAASTLPLLGYGEDGPASVDTLVQRPSTAASWLRWWRRGFQVGWAWWDDLCPRVQLAADRSTKPGTVGQATELLGVNPPTLRRWEREGLVSPHRTDGGQRRYTRKELDQLQEIAQLTDEGVTSAGIRKVLELRQRIDQLEDQLAAQDAAEPPDHAPER